MKPLFRAFGLGLALLRAVRLREAVVALATLSATAAFGQTFQDPGFSEGVVCDGPPSLGTFAPTPYVMVGGAAPLGGGYSPLGIYGNGSMALNGPYSPMRSKSAPVMTYSRGYDGVLRGTPATSFSNPNSPTLSPVVYPTPRNYFYGPRVNRTPPWWTSDVDWIDGN
jgi:hypothetical protein